MINLQTYSKCIKTYVSTQMATAIVIPAFLGSRPAAIFGHSASTLYVKSCRDFSVEFTAKTSSEMKRHATIQ